VTNYKRCPGCMGEKTEQDKCPDCGWIYDGEPESLLHIPPGTVLEGKYLIGRVIGQGGFGITYLAWDINLDLKLAIKEFFPQGLVTRIPDKKEITAYSGDLKEQYEFGLDRFLNEAKILARFYEHPNIVNVKDYFQANNTAYMVMNYLEGLTLEEYLAQQGGSLSFLKTMDIMMPVMDALHGIHEAGYMHRDISPDNIFINVNGRVILIDFGAARQDMREKSRSLSVMLKPGYAPEEQYRSKGKQGPWTDVYAVAATMYRAITGEVPPESMDRLETDELVSPGNLGADISTEEEKVLLKAMAVRSAERFQTVRDFQQKLESGLPDDVDDAETKNKEITNPAEAKEEKQLSPEKNAGFKEKSSTVNKTKKPQAGLIIGVVIAVLALIVAVSQLPEWIGDSEFADNGAESIEENDLVADDEVEAVSEDIEYKIGFSEIIGIDPRASISHATEDAISVYGLNLSQLSGSDATMTAELYRAIENNEWIIVTGWTPHWKFAVWNLKFLDDPKNIYGYNVEEDIYTIARRGLSRDMPEVYDFLENFYWDDNEIGTVMDMNADVDDPMGNAQTWVAENQDIVDSWLPANFGSQAAGQVVRISLVLWDCAVASTYVVAEILENAGYNVDITPVDAAVMWSGTASGDFDFFTTAWLPGTHETYYNDYGNRLDKVSANYEGARIGLVVPDYVTIDCITEINDYIIN